MVIKKRRRRIVVRPFIPNVVTILSLCAGLTSIRMAFESKWETAILYILCAAILDTLDGRIARLLKSSSHFGGELDSLADLVNFGFAPAFLVYCFSLQAYGRLGWGAVIMYTTCMALRLARFNAMSLSNADASAPAWTKHYFVGVPAPLGAALILLPINLHLTTGYDWSSAFAVNFSFLVAVAALLISKIPTYLKINRI